MSESTSTLSTPLRAAASTGPIFAMSMLALCCVFWGYSFPVNKIGIDAVNNHLSGASGARMELQIAAAATYTGWRFFFGAILFALLFFRPLFLSKKFEFRGGLTVAVFSALP